MKDTSKKIKKQIVIFGAGESGQKLYRQISQDESINIIAFVDNFIRGKVFNLDVLSPLQLGHLEFDRIYIASSVGARKEIITNLLDIGVSLNRMEASFCEKLLIFLKRPLQLLKNSLEMRILKRLLDKNMRYTFWKYTPKDVLLGKKLCKANKKFKGIHAGERCFILGNGPSLRDVDFSLLADEFVFTCNFFSEVKNHQSVKANVHIWADPMFFCMHPNKNVEEKQLRENYRSIAKGSPLCFVPVFAHDFICKNNIDRLLNINYYCNSIPVLSTPFQDISYDLCDSVSYGYSVVQQAVIIALYMGFKEIYLLGCDSTHIIPYIETLLKEDSSRAHAYDSDDASKHAKMEMDHAFTSDIFCLHYGMFFTYKKLNELCLKKNVKLVNCSSKTIINEIPRMDLSEVLGKKRMTNNLYSISDNHNIGH